MSSEPCNICGLVLPDLNIRECSLCTLCYHQVCYFETRSKKQKDCQPCALVISNRRKGIIKQNEPECFICNKNSNILKQVGPKKYCHILCALTSKNIEIESYKEFKIKEKESSNRSKCMYCKKSSQHLLQCQFCQSKCHLGCIESDQQYVGQSIEQNLKLNILLRLVLQQNLKSETLTKILQCLPEWRKSVTNFNKLLVCPKQFKNYCWCYCGDAKLNDQESNASILCDGCNRYVHLSCTGMKSPEHINTYYCPGCKTGSKFKKYAKLSDLIPQIIRFEQGTLKMSDLKIIDAFPYIYSNKLISNLKSQKEKVVDYLAIKAINQMAAEGNKNKINPKLFYELVEYLVGQQHKNKQKIKQNHSEVEKKDYKQMWQKYCSVVCKFESSNALFVSRLKPPQIDGNEITEEEKQMKQYLKRCKQLFEDNPALEVPNIIDYLRKIRRIVWKSDKIKNAIQKNAQNNILFALCVFKCSLNNQQKILETLLNNYFRVNKLTYKELEQLNALKRKGIPNFATDSAWTLLQSCLKIVEEDTPKKSTMDQNEEECKIEEEVTENENQIMLAKVLESRQLNPKLYGALKRKISTFSRIGLREKKIKLLYQWSLISKKVYFGLEKKKMSIEGIAKSYKLMKQSEYPQNILRKKIGILYERVQPIKKLIQQIQHWSADKNGTKNGHNHSHGYVNMNDYCVQLSKPTLNQVREYLCSLKQTKYPQIWADLEILELEDQLQKCEAIQQKMKQILHKNQIEINQNKILISYSNDNGHYQEHPIQKQLKPIEIIDLKRHIKESPISIVNPSEYFQMYSMALKAEMIEKNNKWITQKITEQNNEKELIEDLNKTIQAVKEKNNLEAVALQDIFQNSELQKQILEELQKIDASKIEYFTKHIKRNKKWLQDLKNLQNGALRSITFEQLCCLQFKMRTSIFDHSQTIQEIIQPHKKQCEDLKNYLQQIVPYCQQIQHNIMMKENVYNPQSKFYKKVKELLVKEFSLKLYQKDCENLKNLMSLQQKLSKKTRQDFRDLLIQFEEIYKQMSPYFHEVKIVWDLIFKIMEKILQAYKDSKSQLNKEEKMYTIRKIKKSIKLLERFIKTSENSEYEQKISSIIRQTEKEEHDTVFIQMN